MPVDKAALLAAVAQGGSAGKAAYEQAQAAIASQQQEAVRQALASGVAGQANTGAQSEMARIIGQGYAPRTAQLTSNQAAMTDWYNRLGTSASLWGDTMNGLQEAVAARAAAAAGGGGSGGGGSGGGGGGGDGAWDDLLKDQFSTLEQAKGAIAAEAEGMGLTKYKNTKAPPWEGVRAYAMDTYGVPEGIAASWYNQSADDKKIEASLYKALGDYSTYAETNPAQYNRRSFKKLVRQTARQNPGDQSYIRVGLRGQVKQLPKAKGRKGGKGGGGNKGGGL